jgi:hypothetical protein
LLQEGSLLVKQQIDGHLDGLSLQHSHLIVSTNLSTIVCTGTLTNVSTASMWQLEFLDRSFGTSLVSANILERQRAWGGIFQRKKARSFDQHSHHDQFFMMK